MICLRGHGDGGLSHINLASLVPFWQNGMWGMFSSSQILSPVESLSLLLFKIYVILSREIEWQHGLQCHQTHQSQTPLSLLFLQCWIILFPKHAMPEVNWSLDRRWFKQKSGKIAVTVGRRITIYFHFLQTGKSYIQLHPLSMQLYSLGVLLDLLLLLHSNFCLKHFFSFHLLQEMWHFFLDYVIHAFCTSRVHYLQCAVLGNAAAVHMKDEAWLSSPKQDSPKNKSTFSWCSRT